MSRPIEAIDIPERMYPMRVEFIAEETGQVVHTADVGGPGVMEVPMLRQEYGPISVRITFGDGSVHVRKADQ